jgi:hypothetical protein
VEQFEREYFFFYRTLMDPGILAQVLRMPNLSPKIIRAKVIGYDVKLWGSYPALVDGVPDQPVDGIAFEILSQTQLDRLISYETEKEELVPYAIEILNQQNEIERTVDGVTFKWNYERDELLKRKFNLKQWKREQRLGELDMLQG